MLAPVSCPRGARAQGALVERDAVLKQDIFSSTPPADGVRWEAVVRGEAGFVIANRRR